MQLIVFGAEGFIGKRFIEIFCNKYDIISLKNSPDLTTYDEVLAILSKHKPDAILNLAGKSYHKTQSDTEIYESNIIIQLNIHEAVNQLNLNPKITFCSSSAVYKSSMEPVEENAVCLPANTYAKAKYIQERIGLSYHPKQHIVIARLFNVIGPFQSKSFFVPAVVDRIIRYKNNEITTIKLKTLNAIRDFIYINDVCSALSILIDKGISGEIYNVCRGEDVHIEKVIEILKEILNIPEFPLETEEDYVKEGINYQVGSNKKLLEFGWTPLYDIKASLKEIIKEEYGR